MGERDPRNQLVSESLQSRHKHTDDSNEESHDSGSDHSPDDLDVLKEEEDRERLLSRVGIFSGISSGRDEVVIGSRLRQKGHRKHKVNNFDRPKLDEDSEERIGYSSDESFAGEDDLILGTHSRVGSAADLCRENPPLNPILRSPKKRLIFIIGTLLSIFLVLLLTFALKLSEGYTSSLRKPILFHQSVTSNGTQDYLPTAILISLDGFRPDYLNRNLTPVLQSMLDTGVSSPYMIPSFPSVTFPNHWTLVTGLYPESHGIVGNSFYDPETTEEFYYTNRTVATKPKWYGGLPLWSFAEQNGVRTAVHMWPGSEMYLYHPESFIKTVDEYRSQEPHGSHKPMSPLYVDQWMKNEPLLKKSDRILEWLDLPVSQRPQLIFAYVPNIDTVGHKYGPESPEENQELRAIDEMLGSLLTGLEARNLSNIVNIVVVSDHGMSQTSNDRLIYLDDIIQEELQDQVLNIEGWPLTGIRLKDGSNTSVAYDAIKQIHTKWPPDTSTGKKAVLTDHSAPWGVYLRDKNMPPSFHFTDNERIAPLWLFPRPGWVFVDKQEYPPDNFPLNGYNPKGVHGYDNYAEDMRAIFLGRGPGFAGVGGFTNENHVSRQVEPFENVEVFEIVAELVFGQDTQNRGILPAHNGTLGGIKGLRPYAPSSTGYNTLTNSKTLLDQPIIYTQSVEPQTDRSMSTVLSITAPIITSSTLSTIDSTLPKATDTPTVDHKPDSMTWWEWLKWRAQHLKDHMESWWGKVWNEGTEDT